MSDEIIASGLIFQPRYSPCRIQFSHIAEGTIQINHTPRCTPYSVQSCVPMVFFSAQSPLPPSPNHHTTAFTELSPIIHTTVFSPVQSHALRHSPSSVQSYTPRYSPQCSHIPYGIHPAQSNYTHHGILPIPVTCPTASTQLSPVIHTTVFSPVQSHTLRHSPSSVQSYTPRHSPHPSHILYGIHPAQSSRILPSPVTSPSAVTQLSPMIHTTVFSPVQSHTLRHSPSSDQSYTPRYSPCRLIQSYTPQYSPCRSQFSRVPHGIHPAKSVIHPTAFT